MSVGHARVQHVPAGHPYATSISPENVLTLPDPPVPGAQAGQWWPHPALEPTWVGRADGVDVVHLHFGFEHRTPADLLEWVGALRRRDVRLVVTVHDLVNPHLGPSSEFDALLDVVVPAADVVLTLTGGAAREIDARWGRDATVHPHPHVVSTDWLDRPRPAHDEWVVAVHAKSLRPSFDLDAVETTARIIGDIPGAVLRVHAHEEVVDPAHPRHDPRMLDLASHGVDLRVHGPLGDHELWSDLLEADLALLPYRFATHSGWLEMCHDLGTDVLAADVGHLAEQRPVHTYDSPSSLLRALTDVHDDHRSGRRPTRPSAAERVREAEEVRALHARVYGDLTGGMW